LGFFLACLRRFPRCCWRFLRKPADFAVKVLEDLGIVTEMTGQKKNRSYSYQPCMELLSR
jgi:hypothetical protein